MPKTSVPSIRSLISVLDNEQRRRYPFLLWDAPHIPFLRYILSSLSAYSANTMACGGQATRNQCFVHPTQVRYQFTDIGGAILG